MKTILVIEDEIQIGKNIQQILEEFAGYNVVLASNGEIGLQLAQTETPDLIICDIMMPEIDGFQVLKLIRQNPATANIPVIFLTAKVDRSSQRLGMEIGADDYISKPFLPEEIINAVNARLTRSKQTDEQVKLLLDQIKYNEDLANFKDDLLEKILQELADPVSTINLAIRMLEKAKNDTEKETYINILRNECKKEIQILNDINQLKSILTPEKTMILQRYNLLRPNKNE